MLLDICGILSINRAELGKCLQSARFALHGCKNKSGWARGVSVTWQINYSAVFNHNSRKHKSISKCYLK